MPASWTQDFNFYVGYADDGKPCSVLIDLEAADHAPIDGYVTHIRVNVPLKNPQPNGLRRNDEFKPMQAVENTIVAAVEGGMDAIYWGHVIYGGATDLHFHTSESPSNAFIAKLKELAIAPDYESESYFSSDPEWASYKELYPNPYQKQMMANRELQSQLQQLGDKAKKRRTIEHLAFFTTDRAAGEAAERLRRAKFTTFPVEGPDETGKYALGFQRKNTVAGNEPDRFTADVFEAILPSGGTYDGWGCELRR